MEQTLVEQVQESVLLEYLDFKEKELQKSKEEIFRDYYEIHFYEELSNFISCGEDILDEKHFRCLSKDKGHIISSLYDFYLKQEYASINNYEDIEELVIDYNKRYHHKTLYEKEIEM